MLGYTVRFFQRYAYCFSALAAVIGYNLILPDDSPWWLKVAVGIAICIPVQRLLHNENVTDKREGGKPGLPVLAIVLLSLGYWVMVNSGLLGVAMLAGAQAGSWLPFEQGMDWPTSLWIGGLMLATVPYALALRAAIRERRTHLFT